MRTLKYLAMLIVATVLLMVTMYLTQDWKLTNFLVVTAGIPVYVVGSAYLGYLILFPKKKQL